MKVKDFVKFTEPNASSLRSSPLLRSGHITSEYAVRLRSTKCSALPRTSHTR